MNKPPPANLETYLAEADSWARDRNDALRSALKIAWRVAIAAFAVALCEGVALILLTPLKTIIPYTLLVDRHTGYVQLLKPLDARVITADSALTQSFLVQYVIAREQFDIASVQSDYRKVALWSEGTARADYTASMQASNPDSPLVRLPRSAVVEVQIKSVASLSKNVAMVRFDTVRPSSTGAQVRTSWMAVIDYVYSREPMSVEDRLINPLGFKVSRYRKSVETLPPVDSSTTVTGEQSVTTAAAVPQAPLQTVLSPGVSTLPVTVERRTVQHRTTTTP